MSGLRRACFFDRDGVLNVDHGYIASVERFEWIDGAKESIQWLNHEQILTVVVTNQSGIGRGLFSLQQCESLHQWMNRELALMGARIDAFFVCPHHPTEATGEWRLDCNCRKPKPGLFLRAIEEFGIDSSTSFSLGDKMRDIEAAARAGVSAELYLGGSLLDYVKRLEASTKPS